MGTPDDGRLVRLLGDPALAWVLDRARSRMQRGQPCEGVVTLRTASPEQRRALARLLGRRAGTGQGLSVALDKIDATLRRSGASPDGLAGAVVALTGPVVLRSEAESLARQLWSDAYAPLEALVAERADERLQAWAEDLRASGRLKRIAPDPTRARTVVEGVVAALRALPAEAEPIGRFASRVLGSAHALDHGTSEAGLLLRACCSLAGLPEDGLSGAEGRREIWASVGLLQDELSSTVLCRRLTDDDGEPRVITLRQLLRDDEPFDGVAAVFVCENPVVVASAADALPAAGAPLVCTGGQPSAAVMTLLRRLSRQGATLHHHGDFDWGGVRIGNVLHGRLPVRPWRFGVKDYESAVSGTEGPALRGSVVAAAWDAALLPVMVRHGAAVEEEAVVAALIADMAVA